MRILRLYFVSLLAAPPVISDEDIETIFFSLLAVPPVISGMQCSINPYQGPRLRASLVPSTSPCKFRALFSYYLLQ